MNRENLEHVIRAAAAAAGISELLVVGSQSVLGAFPDAPDSIKMSREADLVWFQTKEEEFRETSSVKEMELSQSERFADFIDGTIGEDSPFDKTFGYYAQGVEESTSILPSGWKDRLILVKNENTGNACGWCLEPHDMAVAKLCAFRQKDKDFLTELLRHKLVRTDILLNRLRKVNDKRLSEEKRAHLECWLKGNMKIPRKRKRDVPGHPHK